VDARGIVEGVSDGINALWSVLVGVGALKDEHPRRKPMTLGEIAAGLATMERALTSLHASEAVGWSFRPSDDDVQRVRRS
jgi:hypothetical protein